MFVYRSTLDPRTGYDISAQTIDPNRPHIIVGLAEDNMMKQGVAFTSEVQTIMMLACCYGARRIHSQHQLIPVSVNRSNLKVLYRTDASFRLQS